MKSNETKDILKEIQFLTKKRQEDVAKELGYERTYFSTLVNKGDDVDVKTALSNYLAKIKQNVGEQKSPLMNPSDLGKISRELQIRDEMIRKQEEEIKRLSGIVEFLLIQASSNSTAMLRICEQNGELLQRALHEDR
jgi:hypothetical protein